MPASLGSLLLQQRLAGMARSEEQAKQELDFQRGQDEQRRKEGILQQQDLLNRLEKMVASDRQQRQATLDRQLKAEELKAKAAATLGKEMEASPYADDPRVTAHRAAGTAAGSVLATEEQRKADEAKYKLWEAQRDEQNAWIEAQEAAAGIAKDEADTKYKALQAKELQQQIAAAGSDFARQAIEEGYKRGTPEYKKRMAELFEMRYGPSGGAGGAGSAFSPSTKAQNAFDDQIKAWSATRTLGHLANSLPPGELEEDLSTYGAVGLWWDQKQERWIGKWVPNSPEESAKLDRWTRVQKQAKNVFFAIRKAVTGAQASAMELDRLEADLGLTGNTVSYTTWKAAYDTLMTRAEKYLMQNVHKIGGQATDPREQAANVRFVAEQIDIQLPDDLPEDKRKEEIGKFLKRALPGYNL